MVVKKKMEKEIAAMLTVNLCPIFQTAALWTEPFSIAFICMYQDTAPINLSRSEIHSRLMKCLLNPFKPLIPINST